MKFEPASLGLRLVWFLIAFLLGFGVMLVEGCGDPADPPPASAASSVVASSSTSSTGQGGGAATASASSSSSSSSASSGAGAQAAWAPNCIGAVSDGDPATGCDDGNPCTEDVATDGGTCEHLIIGTGAPCAGDDRMQCWGGECCPVLPWTCHAEGVRDVCAEGSVCFEARCWIGCDENPDACKGTEFPTCTTHTVGTLSVRVCE